MLRALVILAFLAAAPVAAAQTPAKEIFGGLDLPDNLAPRPIGFYSRGCMAGGVALSPDGPHWQAMRLSRNRQWGLPILVDFLQQLARDAATMDGWPGLLVGDMAQPRGGPMLTGHASHQTGLDVDIWAMPMPARLPHCAAGLGRARRHDDARGVRDERRPRGRGGPRCRRAGDRASACAHA